MGNKEETVDDTTEQQRCSSTDGMLELDSLRLDGSSTQLAPNSSYHYSDNDDDSDNDDNNNIDGISASYHASEPQHTTKQTTYFLGTKFNKSRDQKAMANYSKQLYWLTYRNDLVVPLSPYSATNAQSLVGNITHGGGLSGVTGDGGMKTDAGWGCMLRSAQMLLAQTVRRHYTLIEEKKSSKGITNSDGLKKRGSIIHSSNRRRGGESQTRSLTSSSSIEHHKLNWKQLVDPIEVERIANWFADFPNHPDYTLLQDDRPLSNEKIESSQEDQSLNTEQEQEEEYGNGGLAFHWYSLHQMVAAGLGLGVLPGEWYGPTTACHILRELNEMHVDRRERLADKLNVERGVDEEEADAGLKCDMFRIHVATEGCIYLDAIAELMNQSGGSDPNVNEERMNDPLSISEIDNPLRLPTQQQQKEDIIDDDDIQWDTSLLLLLPLRLGIQSISTSNYGSTLSKLISFPQSVGMLGGTPRHALFFYGADAVDLPSSDDNTGEQDYVGGWYGLDPHTVQMAPRGTQVLCNNMNTNTTTKTAPRYQWQVQLTDSYLRSLHFSSTTSHANHERSIPLSNLDPSCALGFYIHDYFDFVHFQRLLKELSTEHCKPNKLSEIITVSDKTPNYEVDVSAALNDMIRTEGNGVVKINDDIDGFSMQSDEDNDRNDDDDDDDDFVLI